MSHAISMTNAEPAPPPTRPSFFKRDYPRAIDQHIDYFGGAAGEPALVDLCGEALLESFVAGDPVSAPGWGSR